MLRFGAAEETPEADASSAPQTTGGKKKKKKKNGATVNKAPAKASAPTPAKASALAPTPAPAPAPVKAPPRTKPPTPPPAYVADNDGWETIPKKGKKKKNASVVKKQKDAPAGTSTTVSIDASRVGIIIGPKGATMIAIQDKTGTKLDVNAPKLDDKDASSGSGFRPVTTRGKKATASVVITEGSPAGQKAARQAVLELAERGYAALLQAEGFGESYVAVHPRFLSEIVGAGGKVIKAIQTGLDVKLTIPKTDWTPKTIQVRA